MVQRLWTGQRHGGRWGIGEGRADDGIRRYSVKTEGGRGGTSAFELTFFFNFFLRIVATELVISDTVLTVKWFGFYFLILVRFKR